MTRRARLGHLLRLSLILWAFTRRTAWLPVIRSRSEDLRLLAKVIRRGWVRVAHDRRRPAGFIARDGVRLHALFVHPAARGQGLGQALVRDAQARTARLEAYVLAANAPARQFYARLGFAEVAQGVGCGNDEGLPDVLMVWEEGCAR